MKSVQLLWTRSKSGQTRWFIDGKRVTREAYHAAQFWARLDCFTGATRGGVARYYSTATLTA